MLSSRDIDLLRPDVAANCRKLIELAKAEGFPVLVTGTVRDEEYQLYCYNNGKSKSKVPTFHSVSAGLAFDICKNVKGQEYSDNKFWECVSRIGKEIGFEWGGDWKSIVDKPHFQWSGPNHEYTSKMILRGEYPPEMPLYGEEEMTQEKFNEMMDAYFESLAEQEPSAWSQEARDWAEDIGLIKGDENGSKMYKSFCTREQMVVFMKRLVGLL